IDQPRRIILPDLSLCSWEVSMHTRIFAGVLILAFGFTTSNQRGQGIVGAKALVLQHVTVIDATGSPAKLDMAVVITGGRISENGNTRSGHVPKDAQTIEARNKFVIPGLWDMHVHVLTDKAEILLPTLVANGITGAREMGNDNDVPIAAMDALR